VDGWEAIRRQRFSDPEVTALQRAIVERRDMRHFLPNTAMPEGLLEKLVAAAHYGPSVGYMQVRKEEQVS
jgi:5,6-dimethylbenzimidazole synthase